MTQSLVGSDHAERQPPRKAAFLDRDGTINEDVHFLRRPDELRLLPGAATAIRRLRAAGYLTIVVTNQSGIARGFLSEADLLAIHERLRALLACEGAVIDAFYHCPHLPDGVVRAYARACDCRKPKPGLFQRASARHGVSVSTSVAIGDKERDVEAALAAGCGRAFLVSADRSVETRATAVYRTLLDVVVEGLGA
jgi:D-glycero-D-manno-heptose 1,7-bisphosphate phosphatase